MQFHPHQKRPLEINITYNGNSVELVKSCSLLGIDIDTNINWKSHVEKLVGKMSKLRAVDPILSLKKY